MANVTGICRECETRPAPVGNRTCGASECQEAATAFCKVLCARPGTKKHEKAKLAYTMLRLVAFDAAHPPTKLS